VTNASGSIGVDGGVLKLVYGNSLSSNTKGLLVDSAGRVGIGTASPNYKLTLSSSPSPSTAQGVGTDGNVIQAFCYPNSGDIAYSGTLSNHMYGLITNNTGRLFITKDGDVGIGTSSPATKLHVVGSSTTIENLTVTNSNSSSYFSSMIAGSVGVPASGVPANSVWIEGVASAANTYVSAYYKDLVFTTSGRGERMRIDSTGNVGIGTASPAVALDVNGEARSSTSTTSASNAKTLTTKDYVDSIIPIFSTTIVSSNLTIYPSDLRVGESRLYIVNSGTLYIQTGASYPGLFYGRGRIGTNPYYSTDFWSTTDTTGVLNLVSERDQSGTINTRQLSTSTAVSIATAGNFAYVTRLA
jgi:hypothetical protein